ncbi:MAG: ATP-grasp domain-containing protein, partial [Lentisphaeria bacterium]|nr:ATP-grasp domain-containing protein [Lentisphaeria bacterium]
GDCTGGAQASMVTHPMVQTYYFSGTNMPFAGQIVVPSYLPIYSTLSNYLSTVPGAMQGLVKHPFASDLDDNLREIDANIPIAEDTVPSVIGRILKGRYETREFDGEIETVEHESSESLIKPVKTVLIHARGCASAKLVEKAKELKLNIILVQSDPDMESEASKALRKKDKLVCIGGSTPDESYLNAMSVIRVAEREGADALHPGIGFLSENAQFAQLCASHGINFIGPPVYSMEWMGNKSNATNTARDLNVPVVPGSHGVVTEPSTAAILAEEIGYPVIIKAVHGGGGKGIQVVHDPDRFETLFVMISAEAKSAFGNGDVYLEKFVESMRHVEVQILRDTHGNTKVLGLRDCSVQRNNQKIIEESASALLPADLEKAVYKYSEDIADKVGYTGAGTVEFIFDLVNQAVYFMEMNTRLQIEHPVTELVTGVDIVKAQFEIAGGSSIKDLKFKEKDYAIELRINAEKAALGPDGELQFIPDPGTITKYEMPDESYITLLSSISKGQTVSPYYDSMIVQIICKGKDREDTIKKLLKYLDGVNIKGVCTNIPLLKKILADETFRSNDYDTSFLPKFIERINLKKLIKEIEKS